MPNLLLLMLPLTLVSVIVKLNTKAHPFFFLVSACLLSLFVCMLQGLKVNQNKNTELKPFDFRDAILHNPDPSI